MLTVVLSYLFEKVRKLIICEIVVVIIAFFAKY